MKTNSKTRNTDDHLSPTTKETSSPVHSRPDAPLSDKQVQERLDLYSKGGQEQFFIIQKIKKRYVETRKVEHIKRVQADAHYAQGIRAGLPHARYEVIRSSREASDESRRNQVLEEAKAVYKTHENLSGWFKKEHGQPHEAHALEPQSSSLKKYFPSPSSSPKEPQKPKGKSQRKDKEMQR